MYGYLAPGKRNKTVVNAVLGMPLARLEVTPRGKKRLRRRMERQGVRRLLEDVATLPLWKARAVEASTLLLFANGIDPSGATVEFFSNAPIPLSFLLPFIPRVRTLSLSAPVSDELLWTLQREYGLSLRHTAGDLTVCFSPAERALILPLYEPVPDIPGLELKAEGLCLPEGCPTEPAIAVLAGQGRLEPKDIKIHSKSSIFS